MHFSGCTDPTILLYDVSFYFYQNSLLSEYKNFYSTGKISKDTEP